MDYLSIKKYFFFSGRALRSEYWSVKMLIGGIGAFLLLVHPGSQEHARTLGYGVGTSITPLGSVSWMTKMLDYSRLLRDNSDEVIPSASILLLVVFGVLYFLLDAAVSVRRMHDLDWSGWWLLLIVALGLFIQIFSEALGFAWIFMWLGAWVIFAAWIGAAPGTKGNNRFG